MWNDIRTPLKDLGLEGARRYLVETKEVSQQRAIFHGGNFEQVAPDRPYHLYILAHGASDASAMVSDPLVEGPPSVWSPRKLAEVLIEKGLPGAVPARIKLILCHSAQELPRLVKSPVGPLAPLLRTIVPKERFAQALAKELCRQANEQQHPRPANDRFAHVVVGGFVVPVNWSHHIKLEQTKQLDIATRVYYRCDANGSAATDEGGTRTAYLPPEPGLAGFFKPKVLAPKPARAAKWNGAPVPADTAVGAVEKYCFFPFNFLPAGA